MECESVSIRNFRNIETADVTFSPGVNLILGENAQGKTNLLEAVSYMALGKSFRGVKDADLLRFGTDCAQVNLRYRDDVRSMVASAQLFGNRHKRIEQNGVPVVRLSDMVGKFRVVLFCPEHLSLIKSGPEARRGFLDMALAQLRPLYLASLQKYGKILKERNSLIRKCSEETISRTAFFDTVELWSAQLAHESAVIAKYRAAYIGKMRQCAERIFADMTGGAETPAFAYTTSLHTFALEEAAYADTESIEKLYFSRLSSNYEKELGVGYTLYGAHKDDIDIRLNGADARLFASQGQQRSLALAMKLSEGEICRQEWGDNPVYLLDDVQSELDSSRRNYLTTHIRDKQVILTSCEVAGGENIADAHVIYVRVGHYTEEA